MKLPLAWLRSWVELSWSDRELADRLTMLGFEVESLAQVDDEWQIEIGITPNRGDAMSVLGLARELSAASGNPLRYPSAPAPATPPITATGAEHFPVRLTPGVGGARFASRVIRGIDNRRAVPEWLRSCLERSGLRSISPVVDITNFVLLELGQPMHAYDLAQLQQELQVRRGAPGETLTLLGGQEVALAADVLVIADAAGPVGMAGIMGGARSAISADTKDLLLEVAWFDPRTIAGRARRLGLLTDASQRFERGVDPQGQERALQRATELICALTGGSAGPEDLVELRDELPRRPAVQLRAAQITRLLGVPIAAADVVSRLEALGMSVAVKGTDTWQVTPPSWRFDIAIEADLIEELARCGGLNTIPEATPAGARFITGSSEAQSGERSVLQRLIARGYTEVVTFGFTDPELQHKLCGPVEPIALRNPIASNLAVMRASLWPGLVLAAQENLRRQRERIRIFEIATRFLRGADGRVVEQRMIAGFALGARLPEQWGAARQQGDFYDLKADVDAILDLAGAEGVIRLEPGTSLPGLHPGRSAQILRAGTVIGQLGELHPALLRELDFTYPAQLFELDYLAATRNAPVRFMPVSSFPQIRRDISFTVAADEPFGRIAERVSVAASTRLQELRVFDIYQGKGVEIGRKSVALGLILQDLSRTLTDTDADEVVAAVCAELRLSLDARIRE